MTELLGYEAIRRLLPANSAPSYRTLQRMSDEGAFPPYVRLSPKQPGLWGRKAVERWIADRLAPVADEAGEVVQ